MSAKGRASGHQTDPCLSLRVQGGSTKSCKIIINTELQTGFDAFVVFFFQEVFKGVLDVFRSFHFPLSKKNPNVFY